jgi:hypothetical protein
VADTIVTQESLICGAKLEITLSVCRRKKKTLKEAPTCRQART